MITTLAKKSYNIVNNDMYSRIEATIHYDSNKKEYCILIAPMKGGTCFAQECNTYVLNQVKRRSKKQDAKAVADIEYYAPRMVKHKAKSLGVELEVEA